MAIQLFLNGTEVVPDSHQEIKVTKENPYFTLSDSYTLDVSLPIDIHQNRMFFKSLYRMEASKVYREYDCRLISGNTTVMEGTARIVQVTGELVKIQLAAGVSALKMSGEQENVYIDRLVSRPSGACITLGNVFLDPGWADFALDGYHGYGVIMRDGSNDKVVNLCDLDALFGRFPNYYSECPRLTDIMRLVAAELGFEVDMSCLPAACNSIFVATAAQGSWGKKLPHWTVKEFMTQFQNFFGCTFIRSGSKSLRLVPLNEYAGNPLQVIEPVDEFQADFSDEDDVDGVMNSNIEFSMESSDTEIVDKEILGRAKYSAEYTSESSMQAAFANDSADVRMRKLYKLNGEVYIGWEIQEGQFALRRIAPFNPLNRFEGADTVSLKIVPAYMQEDVECDIWISDLLGGMEKLTFSMAMPSVSNSYGMVSSLSGNQAEQEESPTMQGLVEGTEIVIDEGDKPDVMNVVFIDGNTDEFVINTRGKGDVTFGLHAAFTDCNFKRQFTGNRSRWSFSLNDLPGFDFYLGQLHKIGFSCSHRVKHVIRFLADAIPDPTRIYIIRNKRFGCEKIEASIRDGQLDRLMTGYFYEML